MALKPREIPFTGRLRTADDPLNIQPNDFQQLTNLRYSDTSPVGIGGMTKINTAALANIKIKNGIQFRKDQVSESHVLVQASDSSDTNPRVYRNSTAIPTAGAFNSTALWTDSSGAGIGRFANVPDGKLLYANGVDACIWGGDEMRVAGYQDYHPDGTYKYDYLEQVSNSLADANNVATIHRYVDTIGSATMLLLSLDNNVTDTSPTTPHTVTNTNVTFSATVKKFGTHAGYWNGTNAYLTIPDNADFDFSGGTWTIDFWIYTTTLLATRTLFFQRTDDSNYIQLYWVNDATIRLRIVSAGASIVTLDLVPPSSYGGVWHHVAIVESGNNYYGFFDGQLVGSTTDTDRPANYTQVFTIGASNFAAGPADYYKQSYLDEFRISNSARWTSNFSPPTSAYGSSNLTNILIGSTLPLKGINWYVGTPNATADSGAVYYWDGTVWTTVGTVTGLGATAWNAAGKNSWTFASTASTAKLKIIDDVLLYWYKVEVVDCDVATTIYQVTLDAPMQAVKDLWDAEYRPGASFQVFKTSTYNDYTTNIFEDAFDSTNEATFAKIGALTFATDALYFGSFERLQGLKIALVGGYTNTNACTATLQYWNGTAWTTVSSDDQSLSNNASFGKSGIISWITPGVTAEFKTVLSGAAGKTTVLIPGTVGGGYMNTEGQWVREGQDLPSKFISGPLGPASKTSLYYYKITFTGNGTTTAFSADVRVYYIGGIPAQVDVRRYKFPFSHLNRAWLLNNTDAEPNAAICSATGMPQVFNGKDSFKYNFGDGTGLLAAASFYAKTQNAGMSNLAIFCKQKETWGLAGDVLESIVQYRISDTIGISAALTMAIGEVEIAENVNRTVAIWQSAKGHVMCDGGPPVDIATDIRDKFNPQHANYIGASVLSTCTGWIDPVYNEYHWIIPGVAEWVYDIRRKKWYQIVRGTAKYLYAGFAVCDANGVVYSYGVDYAGYMYRLENGTDFDGNAIAHTLWTADIAPEGNYVGIESHVRSFKLIQKAKNVTANTVTVTHYADSDTAGHAIEGSGYSPAASGKRLKDHLLNQRMPGIFHSFKLQLTTSDETIGFEPLMCVITYEPVRQDTRG